MTFRSLLFFSFLFVVSVPCDANLQLSSGDDVTSFVRRYTDDSKGVVAFVKTYCPYCKATQRLLSEIKKSTNFHLEFVELDLMEGDDGRLVQEELFRVTGQRTVPNVFIAGSHIGGNSDLQNLEASGKLRQIITDLKKNEEDKDL